MNTPYRQRGMSSLGWITVLLVVAFFITCTVKLLPEYMQSWTVKSTLQNVAESGDLANKSPSEIRRKLVKLFRVNQIDSITVKDVEISRESTGVVIHAQYERRMPLMYNIDVVLKFDHSHEVAGSGR